MSFACSNSCFISFIFSWYFDISSWCSALIRSISFLRKSTVSFSFGAWESVPVEGNCLVGRLSIFSSSWKPFTILMGEIFRTLEVAVSPAPFGVIKGDVFMDGVVTSTFSVLVLSSVVVSWGDMCALFLPWTIIGALATNICVAAFTSWAFSSWTALLMGIIPPFWCSVDFMSSFTEPVWIFWTCGALCMVTKPVWTCWTCGAL